MWAKLISAGGCWCWGQAREAEGLWRDRCPPSLTAVPTCAHLPDATLHTSPNTGPPAQGCKAAPKTPFSTCHAGDAASGAAAPGSRLCSLFTGNKAAAARVRNSMLPQTAALENPSSTFPHVSLHHVSNLQETKWPSRVIRGCETLGTSVIKTQTPKLQSSAIKQIILQLAGLPLMYLRTIFK